MSDDIFNKKKTILLILKTIFFGVLNVQAQKILQTIVCNNKYRHEHVLSMENKNFKGKEDFLGKIDYDI